MGNVSHSLAEGLLHGAQCCAGRCSKARAVLQHQLDVSFPPGKAQTTSDVGPELNQGT